jgi:anaerobic selenocysteine-containing dehydrogenase
MSEVHPSICRICPAHCPILVEVENGRAVKVTGDRSNDFYQGYICPKGSALPEQHSHPGRLLHSLKREEDGVLRPIASQQAMDEIAHKVSAIVSRHGPRAVALYVGTGVIGQPPGPRLAGAWLHAIGSPMMFSANSIDQPGKQIALALHGRWQADEHGFEDADTWLLVGTNPIVSKSSGVPNQNPGGKIKAAVAQGMQLIVIDPRRTETAKQAALHLQPRPGEDPTLLAGLLHVIIEERLYDAAFVRENAEGFEALAEAVRPFTPAYVAARAEVPVETVLRAARIFGSAKRGCALGGTGPSFATRGTLTEYLCLCLNTLCGRWARAGDKVLRPNVLLPAYTARAQPWPPYQAWGYGEELRVRGLTDSAGGMPTAALSDEILLEGQGQVRALFCLGGNPMMAWPDQRRTRAAMDKLELLVTLDPELSATSALAHYVIAPRLTLETPGSSYLTESLKFYYIALGYSRPWAQYSPRIVEPPPGSDLIEEWQFFHGLSKRMGIPSHLFDQYGWGQHMENPLSAVPIDDDSPPTTEELYEEFLKNARVPLEEIKRHPHGRVFDEIDERVQPREEGNTARLQLGDPDMMRTLAEVRGEVAPGQRPNPEYPFLLIPRRSNNFINSIGRTLERLKRDRPYNPAFAHPEDLASLGLADGESVEIRSAHDAIQAVVQADDTLRRGVVAMSHAFGGQPDEDDLHRQIGSNVGRLTVVDLDYDAVSGIPRMGALPIAITSMKVVEKLGRTDRGNASRDYSAIVARPGRRREEAPAEPTASAPAVAAAPRPEDMSAPVTIEGTWILTIKSPTGPVSTTLLLERRNGVLGGSQTGQGTTSPILDVTFDGSNITWTNVATKPIKLKCSFQAVLEGRQMTGKMKAGFMGSYAFSAVKSA